MSNRDGMRAGGISSQPTVGRRSLLWGGGAVLSAAAVLGPAAIAQAAETLILDVACNGFTFMLNPRPTKDRMAQRGDTFIVNGKIYPAGTIEKGLTGPDQAGGIGTWLCRGWVYYDLAEIINGAVPHVATTQMYLLDNGNGLYSEGMEGGILTLRAIIGGHGAYAGASGQMTEEEKGANNTMINLGGGIVVPAPNIRFTFMLKM